MVTINSTNTGTSYLNAAQERTNSSLNKLSSGNRINSAQDDTAGFSISNEMSSLIKGLNQTITQTNDGIALTQTASGALADSSRTLQSMRELALQSTRSTDNNAETTGRLEEFSQLQAELNNIADTTTYNGQQLLNGDFAGVSFSVSANGKETIEIALGDMSLSGLGLDTLDISTPDGAQRAVDSIDAALKTISDTRADLDTVQGRFESALSKLHNASDNISASRSSIADADDAAETIERVKNKILEQAGSSLHMQARQNPETTTKLLNANG